jgi:probable F420-dependent oxidoreductase
MPTIALSVPMSAPDVRPDTALQFARRAEEAGAHSIWVMDRLVFTNQEPMVTLGAIAATTSRVRLGTCVLLATLRPPALLAKEVGTLDQLSGGRMMLGFGVGSRTDDFDAAGVPFEHRGSRAEELVKVLREVWTSEPVRHEGRFYQMDVGPIGPKPVQPHVPIWFGGSGETALRRIARIGDGYIGSSSSGPDGFRQRWATIAQHAEKIGRDPATITPAALVYACVDDDRDRAAAKATAYFGHYYGPNRTSTAGLLLGTPDQCLETAQQYFDAGVETMIIGSVSADLGTLDRLCAELLPRLQSM